MPDAEDDPLVDRQLQPSIRNLLGLFALPHVAPFYAGRTLAAIGIWMEQLATGWLVWELTQSGTWLGIVAFLRLAPSLVLGPVGGVLADRIWPLDLMRLCKLGVVTGYALLAVFHAVDLLSIGILCVLVFAIGSLQSVANPANKAFVWYLVPKPWLPVAIPVGSITFNLAAFVGPAAAGALIAWQGVLAAYMVMVVFQSVFLIVLFRISLRPSTDEESPSKASQRESLGASLAAGGRYIVQNRPIRSVLILHLLFAVCARPLIPLMPAVAVLLFAGDAQTVGLLTACIGAGAIIGGLWLASRSRVDGLARLLLTYMLLLMALIAALAMVREPLVAFAILFAIGACMIVRAAGTQTLLQFAVDDAMRGRVMGYYNLFLKAGSAFGALAIGALSDVSSLSIALGAGAALGALGLLAMGRSFLVAGDQVEKKAFI